MFSILLHPEPDREDDLIAELAECGTTGIVEEDGGLRAFFEESGDAEDLIRRFIGFAPELRQEAGIDWEQASRDAWPPLAIGRRFYLVPPWHAADPVPPGRLRLVIYPGMACGTGRHPCTQLCLEAMERCVKPGDRVLDVGSGSGILSAAAQLVGAAGVIGCDIDAENVQLARERVAAPQFIGSAAAVRSGWADLIIANIDAATVEDLAPEFARVKKPGGTLILSGFPRWDAPEGFNPRDTLEREEWLCWIC
ncbi:MAG TPA: 50S ribosomal protein L11 methyltransferase [Bryobacteraceae bacterium]|nr:50S ribosomal protein L11 methyltransferase [Bryobacteraceae bacterium]